jgi:hypothetical protein
MKRLNTCIRFQQGLFVLLLSAVAFGCKREPITWTVDVALPLVDDGWSWVDVIEVSSENGSIDVEEGAPAVLRFEGPVADWEIPSLTELPDTIVAQELTPDFTGGPFPVPPGTVLLDTEEDIVFEGIDQQFSGLVLSGGRIDYLVESSTNGYVELQYDFPSVTIGGEPVELKVVLPPSDGVAFQTESGTIDLAGAVIDLTGVSGNEINRIASQLVIGTPADITDTAQVYGTDSIRVKMNFQDMFVEQVGGYFGQETVAFDVDKTVFQPADFPSGFLQIEPTRAKLQFRNTIAADIRLQLDALSVDGIAVSHPALGIPQQIARADWSGGEVEPTVWEVDLLETAPSLFDLLGYLPEAVTASGEALLNPLGDVSGGQDFLDTRQPPQLYLDFEWPLEGAVEHFRVVRSLALEGTDLTGFTGELIVRITNGYPVHWNVTGTWDYEDPAIDPEVFSAEAAAFPMTEVTEVRIPIDEARLASPAILIIEAAMTSEGPVQFTGAERVRLQVAYDGTYQVSVQ